MTLIMQHDHSYCVSCDVLLLTDVPYHSMVAITVYVSGVNGHVSCALSTVPSAGRKS